MKDMMGVTHKYTTQRLNNVQATVCEVPDQLESVLVGLAELTAAVDSRCDRLDERMSDILRILQEGRQESTGRMLCEGCGKRVWGVPASSGAYAGDASDEFLAGPLEETVEMEAGEEMLGGFTQMSPKEYAAIQDFGSQSTMI